MKSGAATFGFYTALALAYLSALIGFLVLGDVTQWIVQFPRAVTMTVFSYRAELIAMGLIGMFLAAILHYRTPAVSNRAMALHAVLFCALFVGYFISPYLLFRTQQHDARFVSVAEADEYLDSKDDVFVLENKGDVRVFPYRWITQPHVAADFVGGEEIAMTFCGLSNLGIAYSPVREDGRRVDLKVMMQLENNLVVFDEATGEPFQQIYGRGEFTSAELKRYPTQRMSWGAFREMYDDGKVFFNPADSPLDHLARFVAFRAMAYQASRPEPVFPTIEQVDPRLPPKKQVYGVTINGESVAFTPEYLERQGIVTLELGGEPISMVYDRKHRIVGGFSRRMGGRIAAGTEVDIHGNTPAGRLDRIPVESGVYWIIWSNFYPGTDLRS